MAVIRLTKEFDFEMAHALWNYDGPCKNIHGHSYKLFVTVIGSPIEDSESNKYGMIIDFKDLKNLVKDKIISRFDHSVVISKLAPHDFVENVKQMFDAIEIVDFQPTCENLIAYFAEELNNNLPKNAKLFSLKLYETATSYTEWYSTDN